VKLNGFRLASDFINATPAQGPHYMAPERFSTPNDPPTAQSDIYSCGILLYELLTGRKPFDAANSFQLRMLHAEAAPLPPARLCDGLPPDADRAILCALSKRPHDRFASATSFRDAFEGQQPARRIPKTGLAVACAALVALGGASAVLAHYLDGSVGIPSMPSVAIQQMPFPVGLYASAPEPVRLPIPAPAAREQLEPIDDPAAVAPPPQRTIRTARSVAPPQSPSAAAQSTLAAAAVEAPPATPRPPLKAKIYGALTDDPIPPPVVPRPQPQPVTSASLAPAVPTANDAPVATLAAGPSHAPAQPQADAVAAEQPEQEVTFTVSRTNPKPEKGFWRGIKSKVNPFRKREPVAPPRK
jgi:serine/threonine-protein kinase